MNSIRSSRSVFPEFRKILRLSILKSFQLITLGLRNNSLMLFLQNITGLPRGTRNFASYETNPYLQTASNLSRHWIGFSRVSLAFRPSRHTSNLPTSLYSSATVRERSLFFSRSEQPRKNTLKHEVQMICIERSCCRGDLDRSSSAYEMLLLAQFGPRNNQFNFIKDVTEHSRSY